MSATNRTGSGIDSGGSIAENNIVDNSEFARSQHVAFFRHILTLLPAEYTSADTSRITVAFFALSGLELLGALDTATTAEQRRHYRDWIQRLQVTCTIQHLGSAETRLDHSLIHSSTQPRLQVQLTGYRGSPALDAQTQSQDDGLLVATSISSSMYDQPHLAMTYAALMCLLVLGGDSDGKGSGLEDVDSAMIVRSLRMLQQENGSFIPVYGSGEADMRFLYCACAISYILDDWSGVDVDRAVNYILSSQSYDGGIGQGPGLESHGGSTYCAIAALALMDRVDEMAALRPRVLDWCIKRQLGEAHPSWGEAGHAADAAASEDDATNSDDTSDTTIIDDTGGLQGRPNKPADTCYAFWIGATLQLLHATHFLSHRALLFFLRKTETRVYGGFGKDEEALPDALHSYMGLAGWSVVSGGGDEEWAVGLRGLDGALNLTRRHVDRLLQGRGD